MRSRQVDYASHSAQVDAIREELIAALQVSDPYFHGRSSRCHPANSMDTAGVNVVLVPKHPPAVTVYAPYNAFDGGYRRCRIAPSNS